MKKKTPGKHLLFYMDCIGSLKMPCYGLCDCACVGFIDDIVFDLLLPTNKELIELQREGLSTFFWASGKPTDFNYLGSFTPLRQTIVLFMACLNNEL